MFKKLLMAATFVMGVSAIAEAVPVRYVQISSTTLTRQSGDIRISGANISTMTVSSATFTSISVSSITISSGSATEFSVRAATVTSSLSMSSKKISSLASGTASTDAVNLSQLHLMQVPVFATVTGSTSTSVTASFVPTTLTATITPTSASSKIVVFASLQYSIASTTLGNNGFFTVFRGSTDISGGSNGTGYVTNLVSSASTPNDYSAFTYVQDSPATTSATTYTVYFKTQGTSTVSLNRAGLGIPCTISLWEVQ